MKKNKIILITEKQARRLIENLKTENKSNKKPTEKVGKVNH
jgi:hypothetical protein